MPAIKCLGCGKLTNTACSEFNRGNPPNKCYAAYDKNNNFIKGCGFDQAGDFEKAFAMHLITGKPTNLIKAKKYE